MKKLKDVLGIAVYTIEDDGCLNGLWTEKSLKGELMNEIAKKIGKTKKGLDGEYHDKYIDYKNKKYTGTLTIKQDKIDKSYFLKWEIKEPHDLNYGGIGFKIEKQFIVYWWKE